MQKITPFLWFDGSAGEALKFYTSVFKSSEVLEVRRTGGGKVMSATFKLGDIEFIAFDGGPMFTFSPAVSFMVHCGGQAEVDYYWDKLSEGGEKLRCGWIKDKFGISWQIIPTALGQMLGDKDANKARRTMDAMMKMTKIEINLLEEAYHQL